MLRLYETNICALTSYTQQALALLPDARCARAKACRHEKTRLGIIGAGLLLRTALGADAAARICRGVYGKPSLPDGPEFSLSHGGSLAVLVVSNAPVGADAERLDRTADAAHLERLLTQEEARWLRETPDARFSALWTRKEAVMKAVGLGLRLAPSAIDVLADTVCAADLTLHLQTLELCGHVVSIASVADETPEVISFSPEMLLNR